MTGEPKGTAGRRSLSVVVPVLDEEDNVIPLCEELAEVLDGLPDTDAEVVCVDDGSTDATFERLRKVAESDPRFRVVRLRRNFGQTAALAAGFDHATGDVVVTMDADLQNDPRDIPALLERLDEGHDIAAGWRRKRQDPFLRRVLPSRIANGLISWVTGVHLHDYGCTLKAFRRDAIVGLDLYGDLHRFIPALASWNGSDVVEVVVNHRPRRHGRSKYGIGRTLRVVLDLMTVKFLLAYAGRPGHLFGMLGLVLTVAGGGLLAYLGVERIVLGVPLGGRPIVLLAILLTVLGLQFIATGLLAEMLSRTYHESTGRRTYVVREVVGRAGAGYPDTSGDRRPPPST